MVKEVKKGSIEEKCLERLYPRRLALEWWPEIFMDKGCIKLFETYNYKPAKYADKIQKVDAARLLIAEYNTVEVARRYLKDHPKAAVVNLGAGFSTVFNQIDNGQCRAYNVDTRDVLIARKEAVGKGEREQGIIADLTGEDFSWLEKIEWNRDDGIFFYALDLFHFMKREEVKRIVNNLAVNFPDGMIVFDAVSREGLPKILKTKFDEEWVKENAGFYFSIDDDAQITKWSVRIEDIWRHPLYSFYTKKLVSKLGLITSVATKSLDTKNEVQFVELTFKRH